MVFVHLKSRNLPRLSTFSGCGATDNASDYGSEDCRFESGHSLDSLFFFNFIFFKI